MDEKEKNIIDGILKRYQESIKKQSLKVLIFGPGKNNTDSYAKICYEKRLKIKEILIQNNYSALLPEEAFEMAKVNGVIIENTTIFEKSLINDESDIVFFIVLPNCKGVSHELSHFTAIPSIVKKLNCFFASEYENYWTENDIRDIIDVGHGSVNMFCKADVEICNLTGKILEIADKVKRFSRYFQYERYN